MTKHIPKGYDWFGEEHLGEIKLKAKYVNHALKCPECLGDLAARVEHLKEQYTVERGFWKWRKKVVKLPGHIKEDLGKLEFAIEQNMNAYSAEIKANKMVEELEDSLGGYEY